MVDPTTPNIGLFTPANGADVDSWDVPMNANFTVIDTAIGGNTTINVVGASAVNALTLTQYQNRILIFSGVMTINQQWNIPSGIGGFWYIVNITSGSFTLTLGNAAGGASVLCAQGANTIVLSDGTNIRPAQNAATVAAGTNGQVQFNNSGVLGTASGLTYDTVNNILAAPNFSGNHEGTVDPTATVGTSGPLVGYRGIPLSANTTPATSDVGKFLFLSTSCTISSGIFSIGDVFVIVNTSAGPITVVQGASVILALAGSTSTGSRTITPFGIATFLCIQGNVFIVSGAGVS